jgi:uncharacterized OB-fold protein
LTTGFPLPDLAFEPTRGFWEAAQREELRIPRCEACGAWNWYPPPACRRCETGALRWDRVSGRATLFSFSVVTRALFKAYASRAPYVTGLVALAEDPRVRLVTSFVDCEPHDLRIEMPVEVVFRPLAFEGVEGSVTAPLFRPVPSRSVNSPPGVPR